MKLILIRHAESLRNVTRKGKTFYDVGERKIGLPNYLIPITKNGEEQAKYVAQRLISEWRAGTHNRPSIIYHSGFKRTRDTATILYQNIMGTTDEKGKILEIPLEQNHLLRERDAGHAFEMTSEEARNNFPHLEEYWKLDGKWFAVPPGGESIVQVMDRVCMFMSQIVHNNRNPDDTIYAVTHGGTMMAFQMVIKKIPFDEASKTVSEPKNCDFVCYEYKDGSWQ